MITNECKYNLATEYIKVEYTGVIGFEVVWEPSRAAEIEAKTDGSCIDEYHEYLVVFFEDGDTSTFRNSHADLFRL